MAISAKRLLHGAIWTTGVYFVSVALRFGSNVILSRLVMPEVFGALLIIGTLRNGIELISDVGIGQNIVHNSKGEELRFRDTAWTIQLIRGFLLSSLMFLLAAPLGQLYSLPSSAIQLSAVVLLLGGGTSVSIYMLQRQLQFVKLNLFDLMVEFVNVGLVIALALYSPTIWSLLAANILAMGVRTLASYFLPYGRAWFAWQASYAREIMSFGKWIFLSSLLSFLCASFDKLYLGHAVPLAVLGVYGIARTIADLPSVLVGRLSHSLIFPVVSSRRGQEMGVLRAEMRPLRLRLLLAFAACIGFVVSVSDFAVWLVYDPRYQDAGWILPVLLLGVWCSLLCTISEYSLLGLGRPVYGAAGNMTKLLFMVVAIPLGLQFYGIAGAVLMITASELCRYFPILIGQYRERIAFFRQDVATTALLVLFILMFSFVRYEAGYGTAFDGALEAFRS
ncbi:oligosaccharide flippase family protein (plasmid) [Aminobacter sp. P9b]|uniref:O-antigen/teichoic acid export membrane protein n=1 Tax=Aminobacter niigataensis TaxID=83265 RepID=A0ABR6L5R4_9HYPH|nr:oligosaccharide flippase family protein [Aminobacter niigataensis]MBB4652151.1 O-antigen/teichoic acid export membrane protein [Aminobacter niigataensis]